MKALKQQVIAFVKPFVRSKKAVIWVTHTLKSKTARLLCGTAVIGVIHVQVILAGGMAQLFLKCLKRQVVCADLDEVSQLYAPGCECTYRVAGGFWKRFTGSVTHEINRRELGHAGLLLPDESAEL